MRTPEINFQTRSYRILAMLPGLLAWGFLLAPIILSLVRPLWVAYLIIAYALLWLMKALGLSWRLIRGYRRLAVYQRTNWRQRLRDLQNLTAGRERVARRLKYNRLDNRQRRELREYGQTLAGLESTQGQILDPDMIYHAVIIATYNESMDVLEPTLRSVLNSDYPHDKLLVFIAYEARGGPATEANARTLAESFKARFGHIEAVKHPNKIPGEVIGKGSNITFAGRRLAKFAAEQNIEPEQIIVTTLDADNRPEANYFAYLCFMYAANADRRYISYQPMPMFYNNIWDVPAPMRVIAIGNGFWMLMESMRPWRLRNFSAHAQSLAALLDTDFWSVRTITEDGHQFWRTWFTYDGRHEVVPLYTPIYQDAVLARGYLRTFRAQFIQLRRWAWGASDIPYVIINSWRNKKIALSEKLLALGRLVEGHFSWATSGLVLAFGGWLPLFLNPEFQEQVLAHQLPVIASRIQTVAMIGVFVTLLTSLLSLPPRPARYRRRRSVLMVAQWILLPITGIAFGSLAALNAQTRLLFGRYLEKFDVTEKAVKRD